ncbi:Threonyl/alanyl tRNA synthetase SAD [Penicillium majusculum]|nr:Threonyl/alanyl tRNA synthetase SAD [Penicillium majusculum]
MAPRDRGNGRSREGLKINLRSRLHKWPALGQLIGHEAPAGEACVPCARGNGPFDSCRIVSCLVRVSSGPWRVIVVSIRAPRTNVLSVSFFRARTCPFGNIDLEFTFFSREVLQIGIADMEGNNVLDYFPRYSERVVASSSLPFLHSQLGSKRHRNKDGTLDAKDAVAKLQEAHFEEYNIPLLVVMGIRPVLLKRMARTRRVGDIPPGDENVCLLYHEFRVNLNALSCYYGKAFPLSLQC